MRELSLYRPETGGSPFLHGLMDDINRIRTSKGKVYRIFVSNKLQSYVLATTSKDIFLKLGLFSHAGLLNLITVIGFEMSVGEPCTEMLVSVQGEPGVMLVVRTRNEAEKTDTFHLSPAH